MIDRRTVLAGTGAALLAAPLAAEGQQPSSREQSGRRLCGIGLLGGQRLRMADSVREPEAMGGAPTAGSGLMLATLSGRDSLVQQVLSRRPE